MGYEPTTAVTGEPALSFTYDPKRSLYEQFAKAQGHREGEGELEAAVRRADEVAGDDSDRAASVSDASETDDCAEDGAKKPTALSKHSPFFSMFSLFEGSPTYKQRRKKVPKARKSPSAIDPSVLGLHDGTEYGMIAGYGYQEPHLDRFGRDAVRMSAEHMFRAQARGDFGAQSNPDLIANQKERQRRALEAITSTPTVTDVGASAKQHPYMTGLTGPGVSGAIPNGVGANGQGVLYQMPTQVPNALAYATQQQHQQQYAQQLHHHQMGGRPHLEQRHTYPMLDYGAAHIPVRSDTDPYGQTLATTAPWGAESMLGAPRTKAFVCPLFSCGRMFKRMEHLKRHLRTHTLERPFQCERCQKRFSRSDNLAQHVRTHDRRDAAAASGLAVPEGTELEMDQEPDELDELDLEADDIDGRLQYLSGMKGITSVQMCEVEVQGQVHDVQGDEEGLVTTTAAVAPAMAVTATAAASEQSQQQEMYFEAPQPQAHYDAAGQLLRTSPETSPFLNASTAIVNGSPEAQWATLASQHPSPATSAASSFTTASSISLSQPQQQQQQQQARMDTSYHTLGSEYVTSISAPSHKLTFDHAALYPAALSNATHGHGAGPIRRHRSATPSIARYGESIRRPYSAALSESGQSTSRSYHPYALPSGHGLGAGQGHSQSAQSSPMSYTVPLGYDATAAGRSRHVRSSSAGHQMQMLSLEQHHHQPMQQHPTVVDADAMAYGSHVYRTDSPMQMQQQYANAAAPAAAAAAAAAAETYEMEIAQQQQRQDMYAQQQQQQYAATQGYYQHQHPHHTI